ncbi:hypothetical protein HPB48_004897 [Haemaphysalis longicornis]|uniref:CWH43-like N-terminal domain-containing protein n=1 Tax=Haemaphysalis longicornis TaxID=44386 RepID=A0A9J6GF86_HAELO|nr:hypothetical protein HPB48_004897 [Haemaphysalis longicornis]
MQPVGNSGRAILQKQQRSHAQNSLLKTTRKQSGTRKVQVSLLTQGLRLCLRIRFHDAYKCQFRLDNAPSPRLIERPPSCAAPAVLCTPVTEVEVGDSPYYDFPSKCGFPNGFLSASEVRLMAASLSVVGRTREQIVATMYDDVNLSEVKLDVRLARTLLGVCDLDLAIFVTRAGREVRARGERHADQGEQAPLDAMGLRVHAHVQRHDTLRLERPHRRRARILPLRQVRHLRQLNTTSVARSPEAVAVILTEARVKALHTMHSVLLKEPRAAYTNTEPVTAVRFRADVLAALKHIKRTPSTKGALALLEVLGVLHTLSPGITPILVKFFAVRAVDCKRKKFITLLNYLSLISGLLSGVGIAMVATNPMNHLRRDGTWLLPILIPHIAGAALAFVFSTGYFIIQTMFVWLLGPEHCRPTIGYARAACTIASIAGALAMGACAPFTSLDDFKPNPHRGTLYRGLSPWSAVGEWILIIGIMLNFLTLAPDMKAIDITINLENIVNSADSQQQEKESNSEMMKF